MARPEGSRRSPNSPFERWSTLSISKADRGARGALHAIRLGKHTREDANLIRLLPLGCEFRLSGPAAIEIALDLLGRERDQRRAAIHHAANGRPVAFRRRW